MSDNVIERAEAVLSGLEALRRNTRGETVMEPGDCEVVIRDLLAIIKRQSQTITLAASTHERNCPCHVCVAARDKQ